MSILDNKKHFRKQTKHFRQQRKHFRQKTNKIMVNFISHLRDDYFYHRISLEYQKCNYGQTSDTLNKLTNDQKILES